jgi:hypothetical protein
VFGLRAAAAALRFNASATTHWVPMPAAPPPGRVRPRAVCATAALGETSPGEEVDLAAVVLAVGALEPGPVPHQTVFVADASGVPVAVELWGRGDVARELRAGQPAALLNMTAARPGPRAGGLAAVRGSETAVVSVAPRMPHARAAVAALAAAMPGCVSRAERHWATLTSADCGSGWTRRGPVWTPSWPHEQGCLMDPSWRTRMRCRVAESIGRGGIL